MVKNVYIAGGVRTPFGSFGGSMSGLSAAELGALAIRGALKRAGVDGKHVDEVMMGNVIGAGLGQNIARQCTLAAGLDTSVGATTISKVCGSAMRAVIHAAQAIECGDAELMVAGGTESMSNAPYLLPKARTGYRMGNGTLVDAMINDGLWDVYTNRHMGTCGDQCATKYDITRKDQDDFAVSSFERAIKAWDEGFYKDIVVPAEIKIKKATTVVERDEGMSKYQGADKLRSLAPAFGPESTITAGNASSISDGAAAMIVVGEEKMKALGIKPEARIIGHANVAMESDWFTIAPIHAIRKLCEKIKVKPGDVDLYEINEAFAVVSVVAIRELKLDPAKVNVAGGAVSIGHPIGATGARLISTLARALERQNKKLGIACLCIGGGESSAIAIERVA
ncbi:MAG: thiolase family protein [Phycisphaerae bacterium]|nr:thiolase family protein [Phycisphaerae bacterium]